MKKKKSVFAENIIRRRKEKGWSQIDLAEAADLSVSYIKQIETDVTDGTIATRDAIAQALGCTKEDLYARSTVDIGAVARTALGVFEKPIRQLSATELNEIAIEALREGGKALFDENKRLRAENEELKARLAAQAAPAQTADTEDAKILRRLEEIFGRDGVELLTKTDGLIEAAHILKTVDPTFDHQDMRRTERSTGRESHRVPIARKK